MVLELRRNRVYVVPIWIILGSSLGGMMLLGLLVLVLWKVDTHTHTNLFYFFM